MMSIFISNFYYLLQYICIFYSIKKIIKFIYRLTFNKKYNKIILVIKSVLDFFITNIIDI